MLHFALSLMAVFCILRTTEAQNVTCSDATNCMQCYGISGCGYCQSGYGVTGCFAGNNNGPVDTSVCSDMNYDTWVGSAQDCPDPCQQDQENEQCQNCLSNMDGIACGFCDDGSGCRTGNVSGPWTPLLPHCNDWRFVGQLNVSNTAELCAQFLPCNQSRNCASCDSAYESLGVLCSWCGSSTTFGQGTCLNFNATSTACTTANAAWGLISLDQCPAEPSPAGRLQISGLVWIYLRYVVLGFIASSVSLLFF